MQNSAIPMNLRRGRNHANYMVTGIWGVHAFDEAKKFIKTHLVNPKPAHYDHLPTPDTWNIAPNAAYNFYTDNETVDGVEWRKIPFPESNVPVVADMTSNLGTKYLDIKKYGCIFAGVQKNLGPAGNTVVIVRDDLLNQAEPGTPGMFNWTTFNEA